MREIVLDTETTGLDPHRGDRLVEIGCVEIVNRFVTGRNFHAYLNPQRSMPTEAFAVHGLSEAFLADKPLFADIMDDFLAFIGEDVLVIHNASFDMGFLNAELKRSGRQPLSNERVIDTLTLARRRHPGAQNSLDALCARYKIDNAKRTKHGALLDSELLAEVYAELCGGKQSSLELAEAAGLTSPDPRKPVASITERPRTTLQPIPLITLEEQEKHAQFIAKMGEKAIWLNYDAPENLSGNKSGA